MKKTMIGFALIAAVLGSFVMTGTASAMAPATVDGSDGVSAGRGPGNGNAGAEPLYLNQDEMLAALVELTGLSAEETAARIDAGETAYDIAISVGISEDDFHALIPMGYAMMAEGGFGRFGETTPRSMFQENAQYYYQDGTCDEDGVPEPLNLLDGTGAVCGSSWNH